MAPQEGDFFRIEPMVKKFKMVNQLGESDLKGKEVIEGLGLAENISKG